jgi:hypothetical protein
MLRDRQPKASIVLRSCISEMPRHLSRHCCPEQRDARDGIALHTVTTCKRIPSAAQTSIPRHRIGSPIARGRARFDFNPVIAD